MDARISRLEGETKDLQQELQSLVDAIAGLRTEIAVGFRTIRTDIASHNSVLKFDLVKDMGTVQSGVSGIQGTLKSKPEFWQMMVAITVVGALMASAQTGILSAVYKGGTPAAANAKNP